MTTQVIPTVTIQSLLSGSNITGVAPDGTDSEETHYRGRLRKYNDCTVGGQFDAPALIGMRVEQIFWKFVTAAAPNVTIYIVDDDGTEYLIYTAATTASGQYNQTNHGFLVPPGFSVRVKSDQALDYLPITGEDTGVTGDGVTATYPVQLVNFPVETNSVSIVAGTVTFTDNGAGVLTGAGAGGGSGTIDYTTGLASITLNTPADFNATNATADYDYQSETGKITLVQGRGWGQPALSQAASLGNEARVPGSPVPLGIPVP